jgi:succinate dehydrogenase / fumarate reductase cytochrome b subunit
MRWGGVLLLAFIILHLLHFTWGTINPDFRPGEVGRNVIVAFSNPIVVVLYVFALIWLGFHLYHGTWSSMRTLGVYRAGDDPLKRRISGIIAFLIYGGFILIPIGVYLGLVRQ